MNVGLLPLRAALAAMNRAATILAATAIAATLLAAPLPTAAQPAAPADPGAGAICGERGAVITRLQDQYGETRRGYGLQRETSVVEVYASEATGSWTILVTLPNGVACLVAAGEHWAPVAASAQASGPRL